MTDIFTLFQVWLPYVACNNLYMIPAFGTLRQVWTVFADHSAALIFTISITVGCTVGQYLIVWTDIAIIILIINVLIFLEEPFFGHGTPVWQKRLDPIIYQEFCYTGGFISCIGYQRPDSNLFYLVIQELKASAVMMVSRMDTITKNPAILITRGLYCIGKYTFMFPFVEPSTFRVRSTCFNRLFFFATGWAGWRVIVIILFFQRPFTMCFTVFIDFLL